MGKNQATPLDAPAPNRVHRLPFPRLASRRRQADRRVKVVAATMTLDTPQIPISRQIPGAAGSNEHHQHGRSRGGETSFSAAGDFTSIGRFSRPRSGGNSCRTRWQARCSTGKHRLDGHHVDRRCCCRAVPLKDARRQRRILGCYPRNAAKILRRVSLLDRRARPTTASVPELHQSPTVAGPARMGFGDASQPRRIARKLHRLAARET